MIDLIIEIMGWLTEMIYWFNKWPDRLITKDCLIVQMIDRLKLSQNSLPQFGHGESNWLRLPHNSLPPIFLSLVMESVIDWLSDWLSLPLRPLPSIFLQSSSVWTWRESVTKRRFKDSRRIWRRKSTKMWTRNSANNSSKSSPPNRARRTSPITTR